MDHSDAGRNSHFQVPSHFADASSDDLTLALFLPEPSNDAGAPIDACLHAECEYQRLTWAYVRLQIRAPYGSVDRLMMQPMDSSATRM